MLIILLTTYQFYHLQHIINKLHPHPFTNILHTPPIFPFFTPQ
ncbi:hypothetical protein [Cytobacillus oceanisediminis]